MKKQGICLFVVMCMMLCGCGHREEVPVSPAAIPEKTDYSVALSGTVEDDGLLSNGQETLLTDFMNTWYQAVGSLQAGDFTALFTQEESALYHSAICRSQAVIRANAPEDLRLLSCLWDLTVTEISSAEEGIIVTAQESSIMRFAGLDVDSELFDVEHVFTLEEMGADQWRIADHTADDNPYFNFDYDESMGMDAKMPIFLRSIQRRQLLRQETAEVTLFCDYPYDRESARQYMMTYADHRNPDWYAYDNEGGNCMNFGSQVLLAGGIPMDREGKYKWYWNSVNETDLPFINVGSFMEYARTNEGAGLVADIDAGYYTGEVGDLLLLGINSPQHTTVICGLVKNGAGETVDYLLCSNTTNYRNFPAAAYYYTGHRLVKIYGWNP